MASLAPTASRPLAVAIGLLASARRARAFHPVGTAVHATATIDDGDHPLAGLAGSHPAVARTSRGAGLPAVLPDVHGLAVRLLRPGSPDGAGEAAVLDLLLSSAGSGRVSRHLLRPGWDPHRPTYSSLAPYADTGDERFVVGARFRRPEDVELLVARPGAAWEVVGHVALGEPLDPEVAEGLRFDPFTCPPDLEPVGTLNDLRRPAYRASQARRPTPG